MHGTKGRCELCTRVGESLYSAPFFCGSYFLLLTRVLYLEPPSFRMPASTQKSVYLKHRLISRRSLKKVPLLRHQDSITFPKVKRACGPYSSDRSFTFSLKIFPLHFLVCKSSGYEFSHFLLV